MSLRDGGPDKLLATSPLPGGSRRASELQRSVRPCFGLTDFVLRPDRLVSEYSNMIHVGLCAFQPLSTVRF
jgi:hypothetical protein